MRSLALILVLLAWGTAAQVAQVIELVSKVRIKVILFASPLFVSEVAVDANNGVCVSLDNNLIDGRVQSILIGGRDVATVLQRTDWWTCHFFDNYECKGTSGDYLTIPDGVNNLVSVGWGSRIHSLMCRNTDPNPSP